jgi:UDP-glucose 4-epimerase
MKILVTGGAGFIGSHITDLYIKAGHKVVVVDNLSHGDKKNINPKAKFYKCDIRNLSGLEHVFKKEHPQIINHHAALIEVVKSMIDPSPTFETNTLGTINLLSLGGKYGIKKFIFASTGGAIYGESKKIPTDESNKPRPLSPYGLSKYLSELAINFYSDVYGFNYFIFRYPNVYGPRQTPRGEAGVVPIFVGLMKKGGQPIIFGDGLKTRDYAYVSDIAHANLLALTKGRRDVANLGTKKETSDHKVFETIARYLNFMHPPIHAKLRKGEVYRSVITNAKAKKILGWRPVTDFESGIRKTIDSMNK